MVIGQFFFETLWYKKPRWMACFLLPLTGVFRLMVAIRIFLYRRNIFRQHQFSVPIIVVGNITVGGTGKTPLVIYLAEHLMQRGYVVGIVSRGYGASSASPLFVDADTDVKQVGDEPYLLHQRTKCPVVIASHRVSAVECLLKKIPCDVIIADDGLQHLALARAMEIVVVDAKRLWGNGFCLPAGPLREPVSRLKKVDAIVYHGLKPAESLGETMQLIPEYFYAVADPARRLSPAMMKGKKVHAFCAIGNPERFFDTLTLLDIEIIPHVFPDHYDYSPEDFSKITGESLIVMTEKDAVKCRSFLLVNAWSLKVSAEVSPGLLHLLEKKIHDHRLSH